MSAYSHDVMAVVIRATECGLSTASRVLWIVSARTKFSVTATLDSMLTTACHLQKAPFFHPFLSVSLCLSRACLGKPMVFIN